jgi:hypothetical protein
VIGCFSNFRVYAGNIVRGSGFLSHSQAELHEPRLREMIIKPGCQSSKWYRHLGRNIFKGRS